MAKSVPLDKLMELKSVFISHKWEIDESKPNSRFLKYIKLLEFLQNEDEQNLILELTKRFIHIKEPDYFLRVAIVVEKLNMEYPDIKTFHVLPALAKSDWGKYGKSSQSIQYKFKGDQLDELLDLDNVNFRVIEDIGRFNERQGDLKANEKILFVDDFIGSGDTALEAVEMLKESLRKNKDIIFLSIATHRMGKDIIESKGYKIYYDEIIDKGISSFYKDAELNKKTAIMQQIESKIKRLEDENKFGYKQCEALISMHRIPNNTFPIYYLEKNASPYKR